MQDAYGWAAADCLPATPENQAARAAYENAQRIRQKRAGGFAIAPPPVPDPAYPDSLDNWMRDGDIPSDAAARAAVRDGDPSVDVLVMVRHADGSVHFLPWQEEGRAVAADCPPAQEESRCIARQKLRLPGFFGRRWAVDRVIDELEGANRRWLAAWQQAPLLKGELVLLLDENLTARLAGTVLQYDRADGLTWRKEEADEGD